MFWKNEIFGGAFAIIIASFLWGTTGTAASFTQNISPLATGAFAMGVSGVLLLIIARNALRKDFNKLISQPKILLVGGLAVAVYPLAFYSSMKFSGVAIGTLVSIATAPFFAMILECFINKKRLSLQWVLSFLVGAIGIVLLTFGKQKNSVTDIDITTQYVGIILGLIAAFTYATYSWAAKQMINNGISSTSSMASMFGLAAMVLLPSLLLTGDNLFATKTNTFISLYMAVVPMCIGYLLFGYGLRHVDASQATLITLLEPAIAILLAVAVVGEAFSTMGWVGMFFIVLCLALQMAKRSLNSDNLISDNLSSNKLDEAFLN